ncbi:hypothetical protein Mapa_018067 [Marchantia paleacea]|nr:hypothetical protein Mapa_018067 [Marchantia paleacea]
MVWQFRLKSFGVFDLQKIIYFVHLILIVQFLDLGFLLIKQGILYIFQLELNLFFFEFQYEQFLHNLKNFYMFLYIQFNTVTYFFIFFKNL